MPSLLTVIRKSLGSWLELPLCLCGVKRLYVDCKPYTCKNISFPECAAYFMVLIRDVQYELCTAGFIDFLCYTAEKNETFIALRQAGRKGFANLEV